MVHSIEELREDFYRRFGCSDFSYNGLQYLLIGKESLLEKIIPIVKDCFEEMIEAGLEQGVRLSTHKVDDEWIKVPLKEGYVEVYDLKDPSWETEFLQKCKDIGMDKVKLRYQETESFTDAYRLHDYMRAIVENRDKGRLFVPIFHNAHHVEKNPCFLTKHWTNIVWACYDRGAPSIISLTKPASRKHSGGGVCSRISAYRKVFIKDDFLG